MVSAKLVDLSLKHFGKLVHCLILGRTGAGGTRSLVLGWRFLGRIGLLLIAHALP